MPNANATAVQAIKTAAAKYGIDPAAMIAVSRVESGLNPSAVGDNGHAFGLFQFNNAGGTITGDPNPQKYLDANFNAMQAARHIASIKGIKNARGADAVKLIVNQFERPANKSGEISKALSYLGDSAVTAPTINSTPSQTAPNGLSTLSNGNTPTNTFSPVQSLLNYAMQGSNPTKQGDQNSNILSILSQTQDDTQVPQPTISSPSNPTLMNQSAGVGTGAVTTIKNPKIIGTPGQGTHGKAFNAKGGSDNWESENAVDISMPKGTPLYATEDGTIGNQIGSLGSGGRFAGLRVHLDGAGNSFYYAHLSKLAVKAGQKVTKGQLIGYSGEANGVQHLHLATKTGNPEKYA